MTSKRSQAYGRVMKTLADLGPSKLQPVEQERIREAADALLFCDDVIADASVGEALESVRALADHLADSGRWSDERVAELLDDLVSCGPVAPVG